MKLAGKTIVITGASSGAGRAAALAFASQQAAVVLASRNTTALEFLAVQCRANGGEALVVPTDVADEASVRDLAEKSRIWNGSIDVWVNNAGVLAAGDFTTTPIGIHRQVIGTNLLGYIYSAHAVLPYFKEQRHGILINNISIGGYLPIPYATAYTTSKFGLRGFSAALREELHHFPRIHICDLFPAFLNSPGILHAANYTGRELKAAPPVYDPVHVANAMVKAARHPTRARYVTPASPLLMFAHALFPRLMTTITGVIIRRYLKNAIPVPQTPGNVIATVDTQIRIYGRADERRLTRKLNLTAAMVLLAGAGAVIIAKKLMFSRPGEPR